MAGEAYKPKYDWEEIVALARSGDPKKIQKANTMATEELTPLLRKIVFKGPFEQFSDKEDLLHEGYTRIYMELPRYEPKLSAPQNYFYPRIVSQLQEFVGGRKGLTRYQHTLVRKIKSAETEIQKISGSEVVLDQQIAQFADIPLETVKKYRSAVNNNMDNYQEISDFARTETVGSAGYNEDPADVLELKERMNIFLSAILNLPPLERELLVKRNGIFPDEFDFWKDENGDGKPEARKMSIQELAEEYGLTPEVVGRKIQHAQAMLKKNEELSRAYGSADSKKFLKSDGITTIKINPDKKKKKDVFADDDTD